MACKSTPLPMSLGFPVSSFVGSEQPKNSSASSSRSVTELIPKTTDSDTVLPARMSKKRKGENVLTSENALKIFKQDLDLQSISSRLRENMALDELAHALYDGVRAGWVYNFSFVTEQALAPLRLGRGVMNFKESLVGSKEQEGRQALEGLAKGHEIIKKFSFIGNESGCRTIINPTVFAAVNAAQVFLDSDNQKMHDFSVPELGPDEKPHLRRLDRNFLVATEYPIPEIAVGSEVEGNPLTFYGRADYAITTVDDQTRREVDDEADVDLPLMGTVLTLLEAKALKTMKAGFPQITAEILALRCATKRTCFVGAITNGTWWKLYICHGTGSDLTIYASDQMKYSKKAGLIVSFLTTLILNPGRLPEELMFTKL